MLSYSKREMQAERRKMPQFPKFEQHSRIVPGPERIRESVLIKEGELLQQPPDGRVTTMYELLKRGIEVSNNGDFVGEKREDADEYRWVRYEQVANQAQFIGSGLLRLGVRAGEATRVGIAGVNCTQYVVATFGLVSYSIVAVPLYHNYKFEALKDIVNRCELEAVFCDTLTRALEFLEHASDMPCLKKLVVFKSQGKLISNGVHQPSGVELYDWDYLLKLGESNVTPVTPPSPSSVYIICHTSGTTG
ncbi:long-chain-fatty-acid--CoA ligase 5-like protein [Aphelenchoides avenae]|nr:long-chain-fatty-acid--CoA ligase 5-like protein [Aphelenchus avenae]